MRHAAAGALLLLCGCSAFAYWPNPWDTSGDVADYQEMEREAVQLRLIRPFDPPQQEVLTSEGVEIEAWRDTVLAVADEAMLDRMRLQTQAKLKAIEARLADLLIQDPVSRKVEFIRVANQHRIEEKRLKMIVDRQNGLLLRRDQ